MNDKPKYTLSRSLNGKDIIYIARNSQGQIIFREPTEEKLKKAVKDRELQKAKADEAMAKLALEVKMKEALPRKKVGLWKAGSLVSKKKS